MKGVSSHMTEFSSGEQATGAASAVTSDLSAGGPFVTVAEVAVMMCRRSRNSRLEAVGGHVIPRRDHVIPVGIAGVSCWTWPSGK